MRTRKNRNRKVTHSRYNRDRWTSKRKRYGIHLTGSFSEIPVTEKQETVESATEEVSQKTSDHKEINKNQKTDTVTEKNEKAKNSFDEQKKSVAESEEKLKLAKLELKNEKKELKARKKYLKETTREKKNANKKHLGIPTSILITLFFTFGVLLLATVLWLYRTWPNLQMDELVYEATAPLQGTGGDMVMGYIRQAGIPAVIGLAVAVIIIIFITKKGKKVRKIGKSVLAVISAACIAISGISFWNRLDVGDYLANQNSKDDFIGSEYVDPAKTEITFPEKKRNLIYIYLESMEMTYSDKKNGGAFDDDYIPELTKLSEENENFSGGHSELNGGLSMPGTTWTMGGTFAETSGLPLQISIQGLNMDTQSSFFSGITNLGDILEKQGYKNFYECGSNAAFAGRELYFKTHGNYEIHDINYYKEKGVLPQDYYVWWGFEDEKLLSYAKEELSELGNSGQPFNYTMLTADTHFEDGYVCDLCRNDYPGNQYANVIACSSRQVSQLVEWIQQQPWYDNTTIVISGDHPTMDKDFCANLGTYSRRVYTAYINAAPTENKSEGHRTYSTFDDFPTTLAALGCDIRGNRLGLGTNLFSGEKTLIERLGYQQVYSGVSRKSEFMVKKADINQTSKELMEREGVSPTALVRLECYDKTKGKAKISVSDIFYVSHTVNSVTADVIQTDGSEKSVKLKKENDGTYEGTIDIPDQNPDDVTLSITAHEKTKKKKDQTEKLFSYQGNLYLISQSQNDFTGMLEGLNRMDHNRYIIFIATQGDAQKYLTKEEKKELSRLSVSAPAKGSAYAAVITADGITQKEGTGSFTFNGMLENNMPYEITAADDQSQMNSSIHVGYDNQEYSPAGNGYNIVVWDTQADNVALQYNYDSGTYGPQAKVKDEMNTRSGDITISVSKIKGIPGASDVMAVVGNRNDDSAEKNVTMTDDGKKEKFTGTINMKGVKPEDLYIRIYGKDSSYKWWKIGTYSVLAEKK